MQIYKRVRRPIDKIDKVICNRCGAEFTSEELACGFIETFEIGFGYGAGMLDGKRWKFDLCIGCLENIADSFHVSIEEDW